MDCNINELIKNRRATPPKFLSKKEIPEKVIRQLLENANWAPTHKNTEPWRFKVYKGNSKQKLAAKIYDLLIKKIEKGETINPQKVEKLKGALENVPVVIVIVFQRDVANRIPEWEEIAAVSMAVQNMWLTATELGLGAFWATPQFLSHLNEIFEIESSQKLLGFFYVGEIALDYPSPGRGEIESKTEWYQ
jgi:nitroreductase